MKNIIDETDVVERLSSQQEDTPGTTSTLDVKASGKVGNEQARVRRLITAALPYINNVPHLGHMVGSHLPADIFARWSRMRGHETTFIGGSDEHGTPSELAAEKMGIDHAEFCGRLHKIHAEIYKWFGISYDNYSRTGSHKHKEIVERIFTEIMENGHISKKTIKMFYDPEARRFLADRYIEGTCPNCSFEGASGDQCESCTSVLVIDELINPKSTLTGKTPELRETEHLFLDLPAFQDSLRTWIDEQSSWRPQVKSIALKWINEGLQERGITRDLRHGIPVPQNGEATSEGMEEKMLYVWFEAPIAYMSFLAEIDDNWEDIWKAKEGNNSEIFHFLGKDNIPFHTVFWPIILMAADKYRLPTNVVGMQYLNYEGEKFSKSKGRGVFCEAALDSNVNPDLLRVGLAQMIPEKSDAEFDWELFKNNLNSTLVNKLSNFMYRFSGIATKKLGGMVAVSKEELGESEHQLAERVNQILTEFEKLMERIQIREAAKKIFDLTDVANEYIDEKAPWNQLKQGDIKDAHTTIFMCSYLAKAIATVLSPFAPDASMKIWKQLGLPGSPSDPDSWRTAGSLEAMPPVVKYGDVEMLFVRISDEILTNMREQLSRITPLEDFFKK